ncbi:MAG: DUF427 domain-containing protein [Bacteroidales bacterium]
MKAKWNNQVIAQSDKTVVVEGNHYFPAESIKKGFYKESNYTTTCPWKGTANYYHLEVDGKTNNNAAWSYKQPKDAAAKIKDMVAFWKGVEVLED